MLGVLDIVMDVTLGMLGTRLGILGAGKYERALMDGNVTPDEVVAANAVRTGDMGLGN